MRRHCRWVLGPGFTYSPDSIRDAVMETTDGLGVDLVYEHVGDTVFGESLLSTRVGGRVVSCAHAADLVDLDVIELFR